MNKVMLSGLATLPLMLLTASCGSAYKGDASDASASTSSAAASATGGTKWASDACRTFSAAAVSKATGQTFSKAELNANQNDDAPATVSSCNYSTADGNVFFTILLRQDRTGQETIDSQASGLTSSPDMTGAMDPVEMPRGKAFWSSRLHTLSYIPDNARMIVVTPPNAMGAGKKPDAELRRNAVAIASAVPL